MGKRVKHISEILPKNPNIKIQNKLHMTSINCSSETEAEFHVFFLQYLVFLKHGIQSVKKACDKNHVTTSIYLLFNSLFSKCPPMGHCRVWTTNKCNAGPVHAVKTYSRSRPFILNLYARWRWVHVTSQLLPPGKEPCYPFNRRLGRSQSQSGHFWEQINFLPWRDLNSGLSSQ